MEKDIEILEKLIEEYDTPCGMHINPTELWQDERDAIENLINRVKELELEKDLLIDGFKEERRIAIEEIREENFISKDKIKEKIEELKGFINDCIISEKGKFCESCKERCFFNEEIEDLQDLLK